MLESGWNASVKTYYADVKVGQNVDPFSKSVVGGCCRGEGGREKW